MKPSGPSVLVRIVRYVVPLAVVAALILWMGGEQQVAALPSYTLAALGDPATRGAPSAPVARLRTKGKGSRFELLVRPEVAAPGKVAAWVFTLAEGSEEPTPLAANVEVSPDGAVRIRGAGEDLHRVREIRIVLAPATSGTKFDAADARARSGASDGKIRVLTAAVDHD